MVVLTKAITSESTWTFVSVNLFKDCALGFQTFIERTRLDGTTFEAIKKLK